MRASLLTAANLLGKSQQKHIQACSLCMSMIGKWFLLQFALHLRSTYVRKQTINDTHNKVNELSKQIMAGIK